MKDYQKCYEMYCEAKREINETPLPYEDWFHLEKESEEDEGPIVRKERFSAAMNFIRSGKNKDNE